jgi:hypothetical protein
MSTPDFGRGEKGEEDLEEEEEEEEKEEEEEEEEEEEGRVEVNSCDLKNVNLIILK